MKIDLSNIYLQYVAANTPLFLLKKLREEPAVERIAEIYTDKKLLKLLNSSLGRKPRNLEEEVSPYIYLVALSRTPDSTLLKSLEKKISRKSGWLGFMYRAIMAKHIMATTKEVKNFTPDTKVDQVSIKSIGVTKLKRRPERRKKKK